MAGVRKLWYISTYDLQNRFGVKIEINDDRKTVGRLCAKNDWYLVTEW